MPKEIRANPWSYRRGIGYLVMLVFGVGVILLMLWYASTLNFTSDQAFSSDVQFTPQDIASDQERLTIMSTTLPTQVILIVPSSTQILFTATATLTPTSSATWISTASPSQTSTVCAPPENWVPYTVKSGDSLAQFRKIYNMRKSRLLAANCTPGLDEVTPGQIFYLPYLPPTPTPISHPPAVIPNLPPTALPQPTPPSSRP